MKKVLLSVACLLLIQTICQAQTFNEWFRQKKTQRKYLLEQIAAFRLYAGYLQKGYRIAKDGTGVISRITNGEFTLHDGFLTSLRIVNPKVRQYGKVADYIGLQLSLIKIQGQALRRARAAGQFSPGELVMFTGAFDAMLDEAVAGLQNLLDVLSDQTLEMEDNQRIQRIDQLYAQASERTDAARQLYGDIDRTAKNRQRHQGELEGLRILYNVKND